MSPSPHPTGQSKAGAWGRNSVRQVQHLLIQLHSSRSLSAAAHWDTKPSCSAHQHQQSSMQLKRSTILFLVAMTAMLAVAAAYDPIADNKVPSPKSPVKASSGTARRLMQWGYGVQQAGLGGPYYTGPPFWTPGLPQSIRGLPRIDSAAERRFANTEN